MNNFKKNIKILDMYIYTGLVGASVFTRADRTFCK